MTILYLMISEDGTISKTTDVDDSDYNAADDGLLSIVKIEDGCEPTEYNEGEWVKIDEYYS